MKLSPSFPHAMVAPFVPFSSADGFRREAAAPTGKKRLMLRDRGHRSHGRHI